MNDPDWLTEQFEAHRTHLRAVAFRMLGSSSEADDALQETWLRLARADASDVENLGGWLTTIVARVCLNMLRARGTRREEPLDWALPESHPSDSIDPEREALLADAVGPALLVVLDTLAPAERLAFVLHDMFAVPFEEIADIVGRSPAATRQLASRARRRVQGAEPAMEPAADSRRQRKVVEAFLAASREGDFDALLTLLDPDVVLRADGAAVRAGAPAVVRGAPEVAGTFSGRARAARTALLDGMPGAVWAPGGRPRMAFRFTLTDGRIAEIDMIADPDDLSLIHIEIP